MFHFSEFYILEEKFREINFFYLPTADDDRDFFSENFSSFRVEDWLLSRRNGFLDADGAPPSHLLVLFESAMACASAWLLFRFFVWLLVGPPPIWAVVVSAFQM